MTLSNRAKATYSVSRQLSSQYNKKRQDVENNALPALYQQYEPFNKKKYDEMIRFTELLLQDQDYKELIVFSKEIIDLSLSGLRYYQDYYQKPLLILVTLSFLGWAVCLLKVLAEQKFRLQTDVSTNSNHYWRASIATLGRNSILLIFIFMGSYLLYGKNMSYYSICTYYHF